MRRGYARLIVDDAEVARQVGRLKTAGCDEILIERETGSLARQRLDQYLYDLAPGDEMLAVRFDVFGRSTGKLVVILHELVLKGVTVGVLEPISIRIEPGRSASELELLSLLERHESDRMQERYRSGDGAARNVRKRALTQDEAVDAFARFRDGESIAAIARAIGVEPGAVTQALSGRRKLGETLYRSLDGTPRPRRTTLSKHRGFEIARSAAPAFDDDGADHE